MVQKTGWKPPFVVMPEPSHCVTVLSLLATMTGEFPRDNRPPPAPGVVYGTTCPVRPTDPAY
ncbi:hypothetical protein GCM10010233_41320 [Streptomyces pseudogriseolus]|nr:hypothetical protein GCM10010233_41320 [Streptomyces gancidicus]